MTWMMRGRHPLSRVFALAMMAMIGSGCTPWPDEGTGGIAERRPTENDELASLEIRLDDVIARGSRHAYAAQTAEAELQLIRTRRTWSAGFVEDYVRNYEVLNVLVTDIERHVRSLPDRSALTRKRG